MGYIKYRLDANGRVLNEIASDPGLFIIESIRDLDRTRYGDFIIRASKIIAPPDNTKGTEYKAEAFTAGAITVLKTFAESNLEHEDRAAMHADFLNQLNPDNLPADSHSKSKMIITWKNEAEQGCEAHPEIKDHLSYITQYYVATAHHPLFAVPVLHGAGLMLHRLDVSYENYRIAKWLNINHVSEIDWHKLLQ